MNPFQTTNEEALKAYKRSITKQQTHTPTPWRIVPTTVKLCSPDPEIIEPAYKTDKLINIAILTSASADNLANAQFIVKAVNCHDDLLDTLYMVKTSLENSNDVQRVIANIDQALAKVEAAT